MTLVEVKTADLIGRALDWVVDAVESGDPLEVRKNKNGSGEWMFFHGGVPFPRGPAPYSTEHGQAGPLLDRGLISTIYEPADDPGSLGQWLAFFRADGPEFRHASRLVAGLRAYVQSSEGDVVKVPAELVQGGSEA